MQCATIRPLEQRGWPVLRLQDAPSMSCASEAAAGSASADSRSPSRSRCTRARLSAARRSLRRWRSSWDPSALHEWNRCLFELFQRADAARQCSFNPWPACRCCRGLSSELHAILLISLLLSCPDRWLPTAHSMCCQSLRACTTWATWQLLPAAPTVRHLHQISHQAWCIHEPPCGVAALQHHRRASLRQ